MGAGLGSTAGPVVEGGDGAGGPSEVLETPRGGNYQGGTLDHLHLPHYISQSAITLHRVTSLFLVHDLYE